jgi:hypothetical protein
VSAYCFAAVKGRLLVRVLGAGGRMDASREAARRLRGSGAIGLLSNCMLLGRTLAVAWWTIVLKCMATVACVSHLDVCMMIPAQERCSQETVDGSQAEASSRVETTSSDASTQTSAKGGLRRIPGPRYLPPAIRTKDRREMVGAPRRRSWFLQFGSPAQASPANGKKAGAYPL